MEAAALAPGQDLRGDLERVEAGVAEDRSAEAEVDPRQRHAVRHGLALLPADRRGQPEIAQRRDRLVRRQAAEVPLDPAPGVSRVDVADDREHGIVRGIPRPEEGPDVRERRRVEVLHRSDRRVVVRMLRWKEVGLQLLVPGPVRPVVVRPALLVLHDLALVVEVLLRERVEERAHAIGLEPERELELVARQGLEVVRAVEPRRAVHRPAGGLDESDVLGLPDVCGALEHDVLEEVGEARLAGHFVLRADVVPDVHRDDRCEVILGDDESEAVGLALVGERHGGDRHAPDCTVRGPIRGPAAPRAAGPRGSGRSIL